MRRLYYDVEALRCPVVPNEADLPRCDDHESDDRSLYCSMTSCHECERHGCDRVGLHRDT